MFKHFNVFYSPNDVTGMPSAGSVGDVEPIGPTDKDILNGDDDGDEVPDNAGDGEDEEEGDEENEDEEEDDDAESEESDGTEDKDVDQGDLDLSDLTKAVKKVAPDLFKKIPGLREALERDKEFGEVFATPEDAK